MVDIAVIGCGSLGGNIALNLSELKEVDNLIIVDDDEVETKNLENSLYREEDVGRSKTSALRDIIHFHDNNTCVMALESKFIEGETTIPDVDLVIDCRDFIYDRKDIIDCRMYMSSRYLIIDCRKDIHYARNHQGKYLNKLTKEDLRLAAFSAAMFFHKGLLSSIIEKQIVHKIELDYMNRDYSNALQLIRDKEDSLFDAVPGDSKILNLHENADPILRLNRDSDLTIFVGDRNSPLRKKQIKQGTLSELNDVINCLTEMIQFSITYNNYLISIGNVENCIFIELLVETGAA